MTAKPAGNEPTPEVQLESFIDKLEPKHQKLFRSLRTALRRRFPTANELAYDYGFALVIGYAPAENGIDAIVALRASASEVSLYFNQGPRLPDPKRLLRGSAKMTRFIVMDSASRLVDPDVEALIAAAITHATAPLPAKGKGALIIKSDSAKKSSRKKASAKKAPGKKSAVKKAPAKKAAAKKAPAKKSAVKKAPVKKSAK